MPKQLAQARPSSTTAVSLFSPISPKQYRLQRIFVANVGTGNVSFYLFHDENGTTYDETTAIAWEVTLARGQFYTEELNIDMLDSAGNFGIKTSAANDLNFTLYGDEI